jgi:hypothetical protein
MVVLNLKPEIMRWTCLLLISLFLSGSAFSQEKKAAGETRKEAAQRKKDERNAKIEQQYKQTDILLEGKRFVLEARFLKNRDGERFPVASTLNFVAIDSLSATIQVGSVHRVGYNGVGGFTVQGRITNWKLEKNPKARNFYLILTIQGNIDIYDVNIDIDYAGYATATLNGINSGRLSFEGNVVSTDETRTFKGQTR